jgi:lysozyme
MTQLEGVDVSHHEGPIDWHRVRDAGISFAFIKATEGRTFVDPRAMKNLAGCREAGIVPSMYHFYHHDIDPAAQAAHFLQHLGPREPGDLPPVIDVEAAGDGAGPITYPRTQVVDRVGVFVRAVRAAVGRAPIIYTYPSAWQEVTKNSNAFADTYPLWIASYDVDTPKLVGGWADWTFWQHTDHGEVDGIGCPVDRDRFNGGLAELDALRVGSLALGRAAVLNQDGKVRAERGLGGEEIGVLLRGTRVMLVEGPQQANGRDWWRVDDGGGTVGWASAKVLSPA